jgi:chemotaxis family two-component system sensor kinase Cph1
VEENGQDWRAFLLRAAHDLRAPLRAVRTNAELLLKDPEKRDGPEFQQLLGFLVNGARNADALVDGLSNYALALQVQPNSLPVSTAVLLNTVRAKLAQEIRATEAEVTNGELPRVHGDPDRLAQVLENLVRNAIQHRADRAPRIHVEVQERDGDWLFAVRDNGPGIEAEDQERIFRPFEKLSRDRGACGLGLAICREIVTRHGGKLWMESEPGQGSTFYFTIVQD